ncbi:MAG: exosortase/archaeosortase family protein [Vicinamibacterales bacterium]
MPVTARLEAGRSRAIAGAVLVAAGLVVVYWKPLVWLVEAWWSDGNYSHGFLIPPLAAYFAWERRDRLRVAERHPSWLGLLVLAGSLMLLLAGLLGAELFVTRVSFVGALAGIVLFLFGWRHLRILLFPLAFLFLMIPIPSLIFNQVAFPLQLLASKFGQACMATVSIPVLREGNVLILANTTLEVAEACSGIRSLVSLITLGVIYGYFMDPRGWVRAAIVLSAVPIAIVANGARVAGTGIAAHYFGAAAAQGFFHEFSGWVVFVVAFALMLVVQQVIHRFSPRPATSGEARA